MALQRAQKLTGDETVEERLERLHAAWAPAFQPRFGWSRDSDGNTQMRTGLNGDFGVADAARLGLSVGHTRVSDPIDQQSFQDFSVNSTMRPRAGILIDVAGGAVRTDRTTATGHLRLRASTPGNRSTFDLRLNRRLLDATPLLVSNNMFETRFRLVLMWRSPAVFGFAAWAESA